MKTEQNEDIRVFVVWEPVLPTDWLAPSTTTLGRVADVRARQYWDRGRLLSKAMGETGRRSIVWDRVLVYDRGVTWSNTPPAAAVSAGPVVDAADQFAAGLGKALAAK